MIQSIKIVVISWFFSLIFISICYPENNGKNIKIAILDNFKFQLNITNEYDKYYLSGIEAAKVFANKQGFNIEYKVFKYSRSPLAVLETAQIVNAWKPDVVIGPRNSNMFLLLKNSFKDILVLSPFSTSPFISEMPKNFYSLTLPDQYMAQAMRLFIEKKYPNQSIQSIVELDCRNCVDINNSLKTEMLRHYPHLKYKTVNFIQSSVKNVPIDELLNEYHTDDLILMPNTAYSSGVLMMRIVNRLKKHVVFIGGDDWGSWKHTEVGKLSADFPYNSIRVTPWTLYAMPKLKKEFFENYKSVYRTEPDDMAALLSYVTIRSIIDAIKKFPQNENGNMKLCILNSYLKALDFDKNWYRPKAYSFFEKHMYGDSLLETINVET